MSYTWITPKTNWTATTNFTNADYNRIRNNLLYLNDKLNAMFPEQAQPLDLGQEKTSYTDNYYPSEFNAFEDALESFTRVGGDVNWGTRAFYKGNKPFIGYADLNRIEANCGRWNQYTPPVSDVSVSPEHIAIKAGETEQIVLSISPSSAQYTVTYSSSDTNAATVDSNGLVTGVKKGASTITVKVKCSEKTFSYTIDCRVSAVSTLNGSSFIFNDQEYYYDLIYIGYHKGAMHNTIYAGVQNVAHLLMPVYRTSALEGKWGTKDIPLIWSDNSADYRRTIFNFMKTNFSEQLQYYLGAFTCRTLHLFISGSDLQNYTIEYQENTYGSIDWDTGKYSGIPPEFYLPSPALYGLEFPSNADPVESRSDYAKTRYSDGYTLMNFTEQQINGIPLISGTDKGQLVPVRLKNGNNYTMARLLGKTLYSADYEEVLPLRPIFATPEYGIRVFPTPKDGVYSIDWSNGKSAIPIQNLPLGTIIRDDSGEKA